MTKRIKAAKIFDPPVPCKWIRNKNNKKAKPIKHDALLLQEFPSGNYKIQFKLEKLNTTTERNVSRNTVIFE